MKLCKDRSTTFSLWANYVWRIPHRNTCHLILLMFITHTSEVNAALTALTVNTIQGTAPYLTYDGGKTKVTNTDGLLGITLSDGTVYTKATNESTASNPIELPAAGQKFSDIETLIPSGQLTETLDNLVVTHGYWGDDDGDGKEADGVIATGTLSLSLKDVNDNTVSLTDTLEDCKGPYTLTLSATNGKLSTAYGAPNSTAFNASNTTYYIRPKINVPFVCYAKPNLSNNFGSQPEWDGAHGFKVQNVNEPLSNFPRTGFNGAFFDMTVVGETAANIIAANGTTINATSGANNIQLKLTTQGTNVVRVTLSGPSSGQTSGQPSPAAVTMPTEFTLYSDGDKMNKIYSFALSKWFIPKSGGHAYVGTDYPDGQTVPQYCASLMGSYRVPSVSEYTNANGNAWTGGLAGWGDNTYARAIGNGKQKAAVGIDDGKGGIFAEWGDTNSGYYTNSDWEYGYYWAIESISGSEHNVYSHVGGISYYLPSKTNGKAACVSP